VLINWFTVIAQIVNFLVLVYLLKRFLYKPIIRAMDEREKRLAGQLAEAEKRENEARQEQERQQVMNQELESRREGLLGQMKEDVETQRKELVGQARHQVDAVRANWIEALEREKEAFLQDLRERTGKYTYAVARRVLTDLANVDLEHQMVRVFIERLKNLGQEEKEALRASIDTSKPIVKVTSAFEIPQDRSQEIAHVLQAYLSEPIDLQLSTSSDVIGGIELKAQGHKIAWSLRDYLEGLETTFAEALTAQVNRPIAGQHKEKKEGHVREKVEQAGEE
jgi:F-type H+-transporting ATPase subunit b